MIGTAIEWATDTVNFWAGCSKVSQACEHCYAEAMDARFHADEPHWGTNAPRLLRIPKALEELAKIRSRAINGFWRCVTCGEPASFFMRNGAPLACRVCGGRLGHVHERPRVFVNSMSDFFEDRRDLDHARLAALDAMRQAPEVDFLLLTKRPEKIAELLWRAMDDLAAKGEGDSLFLHWLLAWRKGFPPANIWLGTTGEDQKWMDLRAPELLKVPAAVHFLSIEPMLGPITFRWRSWSPTGQKAMGGRENWKGEWHLDGLKALDWIICGGESGPQARPMHPDWARSLRDECKEAAVPFFFKQTGQWITAGHPEFGRLPAGRILHLSSDGTPWAQPPADENADCITFKRVTKERAGRELDGCEHNEFPEVRQ